MCFSMSASVVADWLEMKSGVPSLLAAVPASVIGSLIGLQNSLP